jgi:alkylated DNA repair dioxygenase AlkB
MDAVSPLSVRKLVLSTEWKFKATFPEDAVTLAGRLWFVKKTIRFQTKVDDKVDDDAKSEILLPEGFSLWYGPDTMLYEKAHVEITSLFEEEIKTPSLPTSDQRDTRGLMYLFTYPETGTDKKVVATEAMKVLRERTPHLAKYIDAYLDLFVAVTGKTKRFVESRTQIVLLRYEPSTGIWLHIDNVARYDQGPIATTSLGPEEVVYDLTPALAEETDAIRVQFRRSDLAILDGRARMEWAHGIPQGSHKGKFTIMFKCDRLSDTVVGYQNILKTPIYQSIPQKSPHDNERLRRELDTKKKADQAIAVRRRSSRNFK